MPASIWNRTRPALAAVLVLLIVGGCASRQDRIDDEVRDNLSQAETFLESGRTDAALAAFNDVLAVNPNVIEAHMGIGDIYRESGDLDQAQTAFANARSINPNNYEAQYYHGLMSQLLGEIRVAINSYLQALTIDPDSPEANMNLASAYLQIAEPAQALPYARRAAELQPDSQFAWSNLAANYSLLGAYEQAIDSYRRAAEMGELADPVLLGLADAHIQLDNYTRAINTLTTLIYRNPTSTAYERLGYAQFKLRRYEQALRSFRQAIEMNSQDTAALNGVGVAYMTLYIEGGEENLYQRNQALEHWRRSLRLNRNQPRIADLLSRYARG
jgi:tetratricopeptide (TPR) repeat protein